MKNLSNEINKELVSIIKFSSTFNADNNLRLKGIIDIKRPVGILIGNYKKIHVL